MCIVQIEHAFAAQVFHLAQLVLSWWSSAVERWPLTSITLSIFKSRLAYFAADQLRRHLRHAITGILSSPKKGRCSFNVHSDNVIRLVSTTVVNNGISISHLRQAGATRVSLESSVYTLDDEKPISKRLKMVHCSCSSACTVKRNLHLPYNSYLTQF